MKLRRVINQANIYISLWCIYFLQGSLYPQGSIISQGVFLLVILISLYNWFVVNSKYKRPIYFKGLNWLLIMFILYGTILILDGSSLPKWIGKHTYLQHILISLLPIYSAYLYTRKGQITEQSLSWWIPIWLVITTFSFYFNREKELMDIVSGRTEITNNVSYTFLALMPAMVIYHKKQILQYAGFLYCMMFILMGMKRGAILISVIVFCFFLYESLKVANRKLKIYILLLSVILIGIVSYYVVDLLESSAYFIGRIEETLEGDSSGRDLIYSKLYKSYFTDTNVFYLLFGRGANATVSIVGNYAHQDWLEILINQGVVGVILYIYYFICYIRSIYSVRLITFVYIGLSMSFVILFLQSLFSMSYGDVPIYLSTMIGYFLAYNKSTIYN